MYDWTYAQWEASIRRRLPGRIRSNIGRLENQNGDQRGLSVMTGHRPVDSPLPGSAVHCQAYLAEVRSALNMSEGLGGFVKSKHAVDERVHLVQRDRPVHVFKHRAGADEDTLDPDILHQY